MNRKEIKFSIIIPAKNEENYIVGCLEGIRSLSFNPDQIEVIVVNNNSTDQTGVYAERLGAKVLNIGNRTIGGLRNAGAEVASGEFLAFIDADCIPDQEWLNNALLHFENTKVAAVGSKPFLPETGTTWVERTWSLMKQMPKPCEVNWLSSCNFIVRKTVFENLQGFDPELVTCEDADIGFRISRKWTMINDPSVKVIHLREPKTLIEFFKKEKWHGAANYKGLRRHGLVLKEIPSLVFPIFTGLGLIGIIIGVILTSKMMLFWAAFLFVLPGFIQTLRAFKRVGISLKNIPIFLLYIIYNVARFSAILNFKTFK